MKKSNALAVSLILLSSHLFAGEAYVMQNYDSSVGKIFAGAKVYEIKKDSDHSLVKYTGFIPAGSTIAYARHGLLEKEIELNADTKYEKISEKPDEYDTVWTQMSFELTLPTKILSYDKKQVADQGKELFEARCSTCHPLHPYDEFGINVWPGIIETMKERANLNDTEYSLAVRFLQSKAPTE